MSETDDVTISISGMPKALLRKLDKLASREHRPRSRQIVKMLDDILRERAEQEQEAGHSQAA